MSNVVETMTNKEASEILRNMLNNQVIGRGDGKSGTILKINEAFMKAIVLLENTTDEEEEKSSLEVWAENDFNRKTVQNHEDVYCGFDVITYKTLIKDRWNPFDNVPIKNASELCYLMRRIVNSDESRQIKLLELIEKHPKTIIFYNFDYELEILKDILGSVVAEVAEWNGHRHDAVPTENSWAYLVNYNAGSEGWNCIKTDTIIFYSQNYSYRTTVQAQGRIDRLNTPYEQLYYYHLKSRSGIDLAISKALRNKKKFNEGKFARRYNKI